MDKQQDVNQVFGAPPPQVDFESKDSNASALVTDSKTIDYRTAEGGYGQYLWQHISSNFKYFLILILVGVPLAIPIILYRDYQGSLESPIAPQDEARQLRFYVFMWLEISWIALCGSFLIGTLLPYLFRYVNPAHMRYWRVLRVLRRPLTLLGFMTASFVSYAFLLYFNYDLPINQTDEAIAENPWNDVIADVLEQCALWTGFYVLEKIVILYITIHYHFRSDMGRIGHSKDMQNALMALYEASVYLYPVGCPEFEEEDALINNAMGSEHGEHRLHASRYLARLGVDTYALTSFFGNFLQRDPQRHWLRPATTYAIVERAIANPKSAAALGRRIWMSFVVVGKDKLTAQDISEVLGPFRKAEAEGYFKILDENEAGDIQLDEMEWTVAEAGRVRNNIYRSMHNADHCINTFDWVCLAMIAFIMVFFILTAYVPSLKQIRETIQGLALGVGFALGRTIHHFLAGVIFVLFDHPFDIGDRIELWNGNSNNSVSLEVVRQSLLYTVFKRVDNWQEMQVGNEWLQQCRIQNVTRSGANRQAVSMMIDIRTTFKDLTFLRTELEAFLKHPDNKRDYLPNLATNIVNVYELNKMELRIIFTHKTNWSVEPLRAARSQKFMCALIAAVRKIPLMRPDGGPLGQEGRPFYNIMLTNEEADKKLSGIRADQAASRIDAPSPDPSDIKIDLRDVQGDGGMMSSHDQEERVRAAMEEAEKRKAEKLAKEAEELTAMAVMGKLPAYQHKGPKRDGTATTSGVDVGNSGTGKRLTAMLRNR
ncbi:Mechanosensitive ion channel protein 8 [Naviculisporaceae sp. PSN 640]